MQNTPPSASTSVPPPSHTTLIVSATQPPSESATSPAPDIVTVKTGRRAQYPCQHPSCSRVLTSPYTRQVHMETHKVKPRKAFTCTMGCGEVFTRQHDRHRHEVALHGKQCTHVCSRCKRFFSTQKMLDRHVCRGHRQGAIQWPLGGMLSLSFSLTVVVIACYFSQMTRQRIQHLRRRQRRASTPGIFSIEFSTDGPT
jgi:hypothetical protein